MLTWTSVLKALEDISKELVGTPTEHSILDMFEKEPRKSEIKKSYWKHGTFVKRQGSTWYTRDRRGSVRRPSGWCRIIPLVQRSKAGCSSGHKVLRWLQGGSQVYDLAQVREGLPCKETNQCEILSDYLEPIDLTLKYEAEFHPSADRKTRSADKQQQN